MSKGLNLGTGGINPQLGKYIEMPKVEKTKEEIVKRKALPKDKQLVRSRKRRKAKKGPKLKPIVVTNEEQIKDLVHPIGEWISYERGEELPLRDGARVLVCDDWYITIGNYSLNRKQLDGFVVCDWNTRKDRYFDDGIYNGRPTKLQIIAWMLLPEPYKPGCKNSGWILCNRYLPKHKERVLILTETEEIYVTYYHQYAECFFNNTVGKIIAWRPLPEALPKERRQKKGWVTCDECFPEENERILVKKTNGKMYATNYKNPQFFAEWCMRDEVVAWRSIWEIYED